MAALSLSGKPLGALAIPGFILTLLAMMMVPLPPLALDTLFTFNIALSLAILLTAVYVSRPLEFGVFPTVLLLVTLLRLALNIASTRVVLLHGHTGNDAAGQVIKAFGDFVAGGDYAVGIIVFAILVIINFVVVTKGAGRISEVTARFTLDAMPGKQMAIDADLNAGLIDQATAKDRRQEIREEADFYGAMDGASKFVRGDAVAGILILFINILGGLAIGTTTHDLPVADAMRNYTLLTIGDGLVAQIPSLLLSTAVAVIVTRVSRAESMSQQVFGQIFSNRRTLDMTGGVLLTLGLIPGMPNLAFLALASACFIAGYRLSRPVDETADEEQEAPESAVPEPVSELTWDDINQVDAVGLEVGYRLIPLVDKNAGGPLIGRIKGVRKKLTERFGFLIPAVHIRDNLELQPSQYRVTLMGVTVGESEVFVDKELAINPGQVYGKLQGVATEDPAFGLEAYWIEPGQNEEAQMLGYTVVDPGTVVATHLSQILSRHAHELLGHEEAQALFDRLAERSPRLVEELTPKLLPMAVIVKTLQSLLAEGIPVSNLKRIAESLAENAVRTQDPEMLAAAVRIALGRTIVQSVAGLVDELPVVTLDADLARVLETTSNSAEEPVLEPGLLEKLHSNLAALAERREAAGEPTVLLVSPALRPWLARALRSIRSLNVLAYNEIPDDKRIRMIEAVSR